MGFGEIMGRIALEALKGYSNSASRQQAIEAEIEARADREIKREIIFAKFDKSNQQMSQHETNAVTEILGDYPEFDFNYAKSCVQTITEMMATAFKDHPKDYSNFAKLCTDKAVMKIRRMTSAKRYYWYDKDILPIEITRYNPQEIQPTVMMKASLTLGSEKPIVLFFCYSCFDGATTCPHCAGVIENGKTTTNCPYCDCAVTSSATEKAWKITDVRKL